MGEVSVWFVHVGGQRSTRGFIECFVPYVLRNYVSLTWSSSRKSSLVAGEPQGSVCLHLLLVLRLHGCSFVPGLVLWVLGIKFRPPHILVNVLSLQPATTFLYMQSIRRI